MESVLYKNDYRNLAYAYKQMSRLAAMLAPPVVTPRAPDDNADYHGALAHPDLADVPRVRELLAHRRQPRNDFKVGAGLQPYPTYVARYDDGSESRLSFYSRAGKPLDFAQGYNAALVIGRAKPIAGHVEYAGKQIADPFFETVAERVKKPRASAVKELRERLSEIQQLLLAGRINDALELSQAA